MATVHITFRNATDLGSAAIHNPVPRAAETITSSSTSQATTATAQSGEIATITTTGNVWVAAGLAPTAASGSGDLVPAGANLVLGRMPDGWKIAVKDA